MDEFDVIEQYLTPLANTRGAFSLTDDAAVFTPRAGYEVVIAKDAIVEGVHFLSGTEPFDIARKLVRVNLSDIAAMGATPKYYLVSAALPKSVGKQWIQSFAAGLASEQKEFKISLLGGDTTSHYGSLVLSLTILGEAPKGKVIKRSGAKVGDSIYVSGTVGDAALGLKVVMKEIKLTDKTQESYLTGRYHLPEPRLKLGRALRDTANAGIDISDGLLGDLQHVCVCSRVGAVIQKESIPVSGASKQVIDKQKKYWSSILSGGDDYELLFTAAQKDEKKIQKISESIGLRITKIGEVTSDKTLKLVDAKGKTFSFSDLGYRHYIS